MNDYEYLMGMASGAETAIGHTDIGHTHVERLRAMADKLRRFENKSWPSGADYCAAEDRANHISVLHGKAHDLARSYRDVALRLLDRLNGEAVGTITLEADVTRLGALDKQLYGEPRQVPPHASGPAQFCQPPKPGPSAQRCALEGHPLCGKCGHRIECENCEDE